MTPIRQAILDRLDEDDEILFFEPAGMDTAILGLSLHQPGREACVVYDYHRLVAFFLDEGMEADEAEEWLTVNTLGSWLGARTPIVVEQITVDHAPDESL